MACENRCLSKSDAFKFAHKSFMEYLFAKLVYNKLTKDDLSEEEQQITMSIWNELEANIVNILEFPESVSFMAELLYSKFSKDKNSNFVKEIFHLIVLPKSNQSWISNIIQHSFMLKMYSFLYEKDKIIKFIGIFMIISGLFLFLIEYLNIIHEFRIERILFSSILAIYIFIIWLEFSNSGKFSVFYKCCKALNIDREEIAKVIGKWIMPILEHIEKDHK